MAIIPKATSSNLNIRRLLSNWMPTIKVDDNGMQVDCPDFFNPKLTEFLESAVLRGTKTYKNEMQFTSFVYYLENDTTSWWMYLALTGIPNPLQIEDGTILPVPDINAMLGIEKSRNKRKPSTLVDI